MNDMSERNPALVGSIEVGNIMHTFVAGDVSHPQSKLIYSHLKLLLKKIGKLADGHANSDERDLAVNYQ